jgi:TolA-binding protein
MHQLARSAVLAILLAFGFSLVTPRLIFALEEESIPAQDLVSATPAASPAPASIVSPAASASPAPAASASPAPSSAGTNPNQTNPNPAGWQQVPAPSDSEAESSPPEPTPAAQATEVPPAIEIGSLTPTAPVSDSTLDPLIQSAPTPARAASLRITEQCRLMLEKGNADDAIRELAHAVSIDPSNSYAYFYLGRAYADKKDYAQAITFLKRAEIGVGNNPAWLAETYVYEGQSYEQSGKSAEAAASYQKAISASPGNLSARVGYTRLSAFAPVSGPPTGPPNSDAALSGPPAVPEAPPPPAMSPPPAAPSPED